MTFNPIPRTASEYQRGAAFANEMFLRQHDAHIPADEIEAQQAAATTTLVAAARTDGEREFTRGYAETSADRIATLWAVQRAEVAAERWERAAERQPEREAG